MPRRRSTPPSPSCSCFVPCSAGLPGIRRDCNPDAHDEVLRRCESRNAT
ncbi:hypothetical protein MYA_1372 [Burkholderia sp. KJ006]|nr:hypothetical protein MYA_1372 [Burkholderia sp. KJ006]